MASGQNGEAFHPAQAPVTMVLEQKQRHGIASMRTPTAKELLVQEHPHMKRIAITEKSRNVGFCSQVNTRDPFNSHDDPPTIRRLPGDKRLHGIVQSHLF